MCIWAELTPFKYPYMDIKIEVTLRARGQTRLHERAFEIYVIIMDAATGF